MVLFAPALAPAIRNLALVQIEHSVVLLSAPKNESPEARESVGACHKTWACPDANYKRFVFRMSNLVLPGATVEHVGP